MFYVLYYLSIFARSLRERFTANTLLNVTGCQTEGKQFIHRLDLLNIWGVKSE